MQKGLTIKSAGLVLLFLLLALSMTAWNQNPGSNRSTSEDTLPKKERKIKDLDEAILELDKGMVDLDKTLRQQDWKEVEKSIKEALKVIDVEKIKQDVEKSIKEIDMAKLKMEVDASLAKVDWQEIKKEIEKVKEVDLANVKEELKKIKPEIEKSLAAAKVDIEKAKKELTAYRDFINGLEKDGLISKKEGYVIEHKEESLIINGRKQGKEVYNKYRSFLEKNKKFTLKRDLDDFDLDIN